MDQADQRREHLPTGKCGTWRYAITPHPEYDPSGKTLLITWTDSNQIHASRVTWQ